MQGTEGTIIPVATCSGTFDQFISSGASAAGATVDALGILIAAEDAPYEVDTYLSITAGRPRLPISAKSSVEFKMVKQITLAVNNAKEGTVRRIEE